MDRKGKRSGMFRRGIERKEIFAQCMRCLAQKELVYLAVVHLVESASDQKEISDNYTWRLIRTRSKHLIQRKDRRFWWSMCGNQPHDLLVSGQFSNGVDMGNNLMLSNKYIE